METYPPTIPLPLPWERLERPFLVHILKGPESQDNGTLNAGIRIWEKNNFQDNKIGHDIKIYRIVKIPEPVSNVYTVFDKAVLRGQSNFGRLQSKKFPKLNSASAPAPYVKS